MVVGFAKDPIRQDDEGSEHANDDGVSPLKKTSSVRRAILTRRLTSYR